MMIPEARTVPSAGMYSDRDQATLQPSEVPYDWPLRAVSRMVNAAGSRWHVQRMGHGPQLLLIHGTAASTHTWRGLMPLLAEHFDVLALDLPGHGFSERLPDQSMSLPSLSEGVAELLARLDFAPDFVVGHSAGAAVGLRMVLDETVDPRAVIGINAALLPFGGPMRRLFAPMAQFFANTRLMPTLVARRAGDVGSIRRVLAGTGSELDDEGTAFYQRLLRRETHVAAVLAMMASWELRPLLDELGRLRAPLYLVTCSGDRAVSPAQAERVAAMATNAAVIPVEGLGHLAHEEQPEQFADLILRLCRNGGESGC